MLNLVQGVHEEKARLKSLVDRMQVYDSKMHGKDYKKFGHN